MLLPLIDAINDTEMKRKKIRSIFCGQRRTSAEASIDGDVFSQSNWITPYAENIFKKKETLIDAFVKLQNSWTFHAADIFTHGWVWNHSETAAPEGSKNEIGVGQKAGEDGHEMEW